MKGATAGCVDSFDTSRRFNPRTHEKCDRHPVDFYFIYFVSIHAPLAERDLFNEPSAAISRSFNPRTPKSATMVIQHTTNAIAVSIHALRRVRPGWKSLTSLAAWFQSTHSEECDSAAVAVVSLTSRFNPRTPKSATQAKINAGLTTLFQSTHSEECDELLCSRNRVVGSFNPRTPKSATAKGRFYRHFCLHLWGHSPTDAIYSYSCRDSLKFSLLSSWFLIGKKDVHYALALRTFSRHAFRHRFI